MNCWGSIKLVWAENGFVVDSGLTGEINRTGFIWSHCCVVWLVWSGLDTCQGDKIISVTVYPVVRVGNKKKKSKLDANILLI